MTVTEFLLARLAEDEETARAAVQDEWKTSGHSVWGGAFPRAGVDWFDTYDEGGLGPGECYHMVRWQPARVLRECEAKRRIVALHEMKDPVTPYERSWGGQTTGCHICHEFDGIVCGGGPCETLIALAAVYAEHPDYDPTWAMTP